MLGNLMGWHLLVLAGIGLTALAVIVGIVLLAVWLGGRGDARTTRLQHEADALRERAERAERDTDGLV